MSDGAGGAKYEADVYTDAYTRAGGGQGNIFAEPTARGDAEATARAYSVTRGKVLMEGQSFREGLPSSDQEYLAHDHQALYDMAHSGNAQLVDEKGRMLARTRDALKTLSDDLTSAVNNEQALWQGEGAAQVHGFVKQSADWVDSTAHGVDLASNRYSQQSAAVVNAQNSMPEPVPFNQADEMAKAQQAFQSGGFDGNMQGVKALEEMSAKQEASQAAHQQAAQVMHTMDNTLYETGSTQPSFAAPPTLGGGQPSTPVAGTGAGPVTSAPGGPTGGMPGGGYVGSGPGSAPGYTPGGPAPVTSNAPAGGGFKGTPPAIAGQVGGGNLGNLGADKNRAPKPTTGMKFGNPSAGARVSGGGTYSPPKGPAGAAGRLGGTPAGGVPKGAEQAAGAGKSSGSGGPPPKEGTMRGGAAAAASTASGKPGAGMGGAPAGAGRGKEEDKDKKRPDYLQGEDPDELFDAKPAEGLDGAKPVPPVIGS